MKSMINGQILHQSHISEVVLTTQILLVLYVVPNIYQKLESVKCILSTMSTLNVLFEKMIIISPMSGRTKIELAVIGDRCPLSMCTGRKKKESMYSFR